MSKIGAFGVIPVENCCKQTNPTIPPSSHVIQTHSHTERGNGMFMWHLSTVIDEVLFTVYAFPWAVFFQLLFCMRTLTDDYFQSWCFRCSGYVVQYSDDSVHISASFSSRKKSQRCCGSMVCIPTCSFVIGVQRSDRIICLPVHGGNARRLFASPAT